MRLANPFEMLLGEPRPTARPRSAAAGAPGMRRIGDRPHKARAPRAPENTVFIAADSLARAEEIAHEHGLAPWEWRMVVSFRDVNWHRLGPDTRIIEDSRGCEVSRYLRRALAR